MIGFEQRDLADKDIDPLGLSVEYRLAILEATALLNTTKLLLTIVSTLSDAVALGTLAFLTIAKVGQ